jgi:hypothetical protein
MVRRPVVRMAPTHSARKRGRVGCVDATERLNSSGCAAHDILIVVASLPARDGLAGFISCRLGASVIRRYLMVTAENGKSRAQVPFIFTSVRLTARQPARCASFWRRALAMGVRRILPSVPSRQELSGRKIRRTSAPTSAGPAESRCPQGARRGTPQPARSLAQTDQALHHTATGSGLPECC